MAETTSSHRSHGPAGVSKRPLSPHLSIYQPQLTSGLSIFHKITGIAMAGAMGLVVAWLACLAWFPEYLEWALWAVGWWIVKAALIGWTWAYFYHYSCSIRYLFWATGRGLELRHVYGWGYAVLAFSFAATAALWAPILMAGAR